MNKETLAFGAALIGLLVHNSASAHTDVPVIADTGATVASEDGSKLTGVMPLDEQFSLAPAAPASDLTVPSEALASFASENGGGGAPTAAPLGVGGAIQARRPYGFSTYAEQTGKVGWQVLAVTAAITATRFKDFTSEGSKFYHRNEGFFGRNTKSLGMDKMHHAWKSYVLTDVLQSIIENKTGDRKGAAYTSAILGFGIMAYAEVLDGYTARTGFSREDVAVHAFGSAVSLVRNVVPGMRDKLDFRMEANPFNSGGGLNLVNQLSRRKYLFATQLSGFRKLESSPLRFAEIHVGYAGRGFTPEERLRGEPLKRKIFFGLGLNVQKLFARKPKSKIERYAKGVFDYYQPPYTAIRN